MGLHHPMSQESRQLMTMEGTLLQKLVAAGGLAIAIVAGGPIKAVAASAIRPLVASHGVVSAVVKRDLCHGKGIGTRTCYTCCRTYGLSASRCLRNCRKD
jgi:hypothetical protein